MPGLPVPYHPLPVESHDRPLALTVADVQEPVVFAVIRDDTPSAPIVDLHAFFPIKDLRGIIQGTGYDVKKVDTWAASSLQLIFAEKPKQPLGAVRGDRHEQPAGVE